MKAFSHILAVSALSAGLMAPVSAVDDTAPADQFKDLDPFFAEFESIHRSIEKAAVQVHKEIEKSIEETKKLVGTPVDFNKFTIQALKKVDGVVYGVKVTLPGIDEKSIKIKVCNDSGNKLLTITGLLTAAAKEEATEEVANDQKDVQQETPKDSKPTAAKTKVTCKYTATRMYSDCRVINNCEQTITVKNNEVTVTINLPSDVDISSLKHSFAQAPEKDVLTIQFTKNDKQSYEFTVDSEK